VRALQNTHPALAIALKSASVMNVLQCANNFACATSRSWNSANVHSSIIAGLVKPSNKLGVIHLCDGGEKIKNTRPERRGRITTNLEDEPTPEVDTADFFRTIGKSRRKTWGVQRPMRPSKGECSKKGRKEQRGKH
jgi:hypothetical protein